MRGVPVSIVLAGLLLFASALHAADPGALARIVDTQCLPHAQASAGPAPCAAVDVAGGYAILKDINGAYQYLLVAAAPVSGIEDPALLAPDAPNYWRAAWNAHGFVEAALGRRLPRDWVSLAINSRYGRSQNRLHIHIECLGRAAHDVLAADDAEITTQWRLLKLAGHAYQVRRVEGPELEPAPFKLAAETLPGARDGMRAYTLLVAGTSADRGPGFYLLADRAFSTAFDLGHAEELQDHGCALDKGGP